MKTNQSAKATKSLQNFKTLFMVLIAVLGFSLAGRSQTKSTIGGQNCPRQLAQGEINTINHFPDFLLDCSGSEIKNPVVKFADCVNDAFAIGGQYPPRTRDIYPKLGIAALACITDANELANHHKSIVSVKPVGLGKFTFKTLRHVSIGGNQGPPRIPLT